MKFSARTGRRGFTLVEVVLALGVVSFCLVTLMGLLATGLLSNKTAIEKSAAVNIAGAAVADIRATPLSSQTYTSGQVLTSPRFGFLVPAPSTGTGMQTVYVADDGTPVTAVNANLTSSSAIYRVSVMGPARPSLANQRLASPIYVLVTWPAQADPTAASLPSHYAGSFQTVTYLDQN
jgi:uncharacterized protein (TIGR02598 family)